MERPALDQSVDLLNRSQQVLLAVAAHPTMDALASMVGLSLGLETIGKTATMISASHVPSSLQFLPGTSQIQETLARTTDLIVDIPVGGVRASQVRWEVLQETLRLILSPEKGREFPEGIPVIARGLYPWELILTVGAPDLHHLGPPFADHAPFFYDTPIINIDRGTANEFFGSVNLVPATAGTVAEVVYDLLLTLGGTHLLTPEAATCLYAGILTGTHSFQSPNTTPRTFAVASALLEQDADRQAVTRHLFMTHTLPELRLVGRTLARLQEAVEGVLWSNLAQKDFAESGATPDDLPAVLQEVSERAGERTPVLLAFERSPKTLEALIFPGRMSADDRAQLAERLQAVPAGPFLLVALGAQEPAAAEGLLRSIVLPHLPSRSHGL